MMRGKLRDYFQGIGYKRLTPVEVDPSTSNEHEFNGITPFRELFGTAKQHFCVKMLYLCDAGDDIVEDNAIFTWYDARQNHPTRTEYRLYYRSSSCIAKASPGDLMVLAVNHPTDEQSKSLTVCIARAGDTIEKQLAWLFGIDLCCVSNQAIVQRESDRSIDYFTALILEKLGIHIEENDTNLLNQLVQRFHNEFPATYAFSEFVRSIDTSVDCRNNPDEALITWMENEERAFRLLENKIVQEKLDQGFTDVDDFVNFSLSIHNRRKARAGYALEHHLCYIFDSFGIRYSYNQITENRSRPDFLFPGIEEYRNMNYPQTSLTMLGVKTTCKDRWRQVLSEAQRISHKHLLTLEPSISITQTTEMQDKNLQLIVPQQIFGSYTEQQQQWLMNLSEFIQLIQEREA